MTTTQALVVDANILVRAVLGVRVFQLLNKYEGKVSFYSPAKCFEEARQHLPAILARRRIGIPAGMAIFEEISGVVTPVDQKVYTEYESLARERIEKRDPNDWPVVAVALPAGCPIWTEDMDFFGCGIATWTTDRVEIYLREPSTPSGLAS